MRPDFTRASLAAAAVLLLLPVAQGLDLWATARTQADQPGIYLSLDEIREIASRIRAGRSLQPASWPNGARVAVLLSFDVDNDTITIARNAEPSPGAMSQGEYGARVGLRRVVELMDRHEIPASFFIPAVSLVVAPEMVDVIQASGRHEFGVHGWIHELNSALDAETETRVLTNLRQWAHDRIVFLITHRYSTIQTASQIALLEDGAIVACGSHDELMADQTSRYRTFFEGEIAVATDMGGESV